MQQSGYIVLCLRLEYQEERSLSRNAMRQLSDELLVELYHRAVDHKLDNEFIQLIKEELRNRSIIINRTKSS